MLALTIRQPFAWAMAHGKDVENRGWFPPEYAIGQEIAIHAAETKKFTCGYGNAFYVRELRAKLGQEIPVKEFAYGAVLSVATLAGWARFVDGSPFPQMRKIDGVHFYDRILASRHLDSRAYHWLFIEAVELKIPVPCKGRQKLWTLPSEVAAEVVKQLGRALHEGSVEEVFRR